MRKLAALVSVVFFTLTVVRAAPAGGEIAAVQEASWGLSDFGNSTTVSRFSALGWAVEEADSRMFVGGNFLNVTNGDRTESQPYLAAFHSRTGVWDDSFAPVVERPVLTIETLPDGGLMLGGEIRNYNGQDVSSLVKVDPVTGDIWPGWNTRVFGGSNVVREVSLEPDGWLYVAGTFTNATDGAQGNSVSNLIRMNPDTGAIDWSWTPQISGGSVWGVSASRTNSTVYVAGWFTSAAGAASPAVGISTTDDTNVTWNGFEMNYPCCGHMFDVEATEFGTVFLIGEQHAAYVYDENQNMALIRSHVTSHNTDYQDSNTRRGGDYQEIERDGNRIYATCHCWGSHTSYNGGHQLTNWDLALAGGEHTGLVNSIIAYDVQTGIRDQAFNPRMTGDIGGFGVKVASDGCVWATGGFNSVGVPGSQAAARDLVRLCDEDAIQTTIDGPEVCESTAAGGNIDVTWDEVDGAKAYVVYRTVDGGNQQWRGRVEQSPFVDTNRDGELAYMVSARGADNTISPPTVCDVQEEVVPDLGSPANCRAVVDGAAIDVTWDEVGGAANYIVYRSVDGGTVWWRGKVASTDFSDSNRSGELEYSVVAEADDGTRSASATCSFTEEPPPGEPQPVAACTTAAGGGTVEVSWDAVDNADLYVVYRTVDDSPQFWRGRTTDLSFEDSLRDGGISYFVATKFNNQFSERVACG